MQVLENRWTWSSTFSCLNPVSRKKESWLACKNGFAVCLICASRYGGGAGPTKFANGQGSLRRKDCITQHSTSAEHKEAQQAWEQRLRAEATQGLGETISVFTGPAPAASAKAASGKVAPSTAAAGAVVRTPKSTMGYRFSGSAFPPLNNSKTTIAISAQEWVPLPRLELPLSLGSGRGGGSARGSQERQSTVGK